MLALKTALFGTFVVSSFLVGIPYLISRLTEASLSYDIGPFRWLGFLLILPAAVLFFSTMFSLAHFGQGTPAPFDPPKELVVRGPYRYTRNPGYLGAVTIVAGESVVLQSYAVLIYAGAIWAMFHLFVSLYEEPGLRVRFGKAYLDYCQEVPRWIPRLPRQRFPV